MDEQEPDGMAVESELRGALQSASRIISDAVDSAGSSDNPRKHLESRTLTFISNKPATNSSQPDKRQRAFPPHTPKNFRLVRTTSNETATPSQITSEKPLQTATFQFVSVVPVSSTAGESSARTDTADNTSPRPTLLLHVTPGNSASGSNIRATTTTLGSNAQAVQCIFRMVPLNDARGTAGAKGTQPKFTLSRVNNQDFPKVIVVPAPSEPSSGTSKSPDLVRQLRHKDTGPAGLGNDITGISTQTALYRIISSTIPSPSASMAASSNGQMKPTKIFKVSDRRDVSGMSSVVAKPIEGSVISARPEVLPLLSIIPRDAAWTSMVDAYELSGLSARCSVEKEKKVVKDLEKLRCIYEDTQFVWKQLPKPTPLEIPGATLSKIGELLSIGRFIEILQYEHKPTRHKRKRFDYEFLVDAVVLRDGNVGAYLSILNWFVWAFDERKEYEARLQIPPEFTVSIQRLAGDHILACETLRQYIVVAKKFKEAPYTEEFLIVLEKLKYVDVADLTADERITLLTTAHSILIQDTGFVNACLGRLEQECTQAYAKKAELDVTIRTKEFQLTVMEQNLKTFDERSKSTRSEDRERTAIFDGMKAVTKDIESLRADRIETETEANEAKRFSTYMSHSDCLGYDRNFNRYWHFPELCNGLLVESGWAAPVFPRKMDLPGNSLPTVLGNFVYPQRPQEVYYLMPDGKYRKCDNRLIFPPHGANAWTMYDVKAIPDLIAQLNPMGLREGRLKLRLQADLEKLTHVTTRMLPTIAEDLLGILKEFFAKVFTDLVENQFLIQPVDNNWKEKLDAADLSEFKKLVVWTFFAISPVLIHRAFLLAVEKVWKDVVEETNNLSRVYYFCKLLDNCIRWERRIANEQCNYCPVKQRRNRMRRCFGCAAVFHNEDCMEFTENNLCQDCAVASVARNVVTVENSSDSQKADSSTLSVFNESPVGPCVDFSELVSEDGTPEKDKTRGKRRSSTDSAGSSSKLLRVGESAEEITKAVPESSGKQNISRPDEMAVSVDNSPLE